jgi:hypothetical protein
MKKIGGVTGDREGSRRPLGILEGLEGHRGAPVTAEEIFTTSVVILNFIISSQNKLQSACMAEKTTMTTVVMGPKIVLRSYVNFLMSQVPEKSTS